MAGPTSLLLLYVTQFMNELNEFFSITKNLVSHQKQKLHINLISKAKISVSVLGYMSIKEGKKRGLPHNHILLWLTNKLHIHRLDNPISVEIPKSDEYPQLLNCMEHRRFTDPLITAILIHHA